MPRQHGTCEHAYWDRSQCPYCLIRALRYQLIVAKAAVRAAQRDFDVVAGENARLSYLLGAKQARERARGRERNRRAAARKASQ